MNGKFTAQGNNLVKAEQGDWKKKNEEGGRVKIDNSPEGI